MGGGEGRLGTFSSAWLVLERFIEFRTKLLAQA